MGSPMSSTILSMQSVCSSWKYPRSLENVGSTLAQVGLRMSGACTCLTRFKRDAEHIRISTYCQTKAEFATPNLQLSRDHRDVLRFHLHQRAVVWIEAGLTASTDSQIQIFDSRCCPAKLLENNNNFENWVSYLVHYKPSGTSENPFHFSRWELFLVELGIWFVKARFLQPV